LTLSIEKRPPGLSPKDLHEAVSLLRRELFIENPAGFLDAHQRVLRRVTHDRNREVIEYRLTVVTLFNSPDGGYAAVLVVGCLEVDARTERLAVAGVEYGSF
jgi:hypothetical protein